MLTNKFIDDAISGDTRYERYAGKILDFNGCLDFLMQIDCTFAVYYEIPAKAWAICIKEASNKYIIDLDFDERERFIKISKIASKDNYAFEQRIGSVLLNHFNPVQFNDLKIHWGKNVVSLEDTTAEDGLDAN